MKTSVGNNRTYIIQNKDRDEGGFFQLQHNSGSERVCFFLLSLQENIVLDLISNQPA